MISAWRRDDREGWVTVFGRVHRAVQEVAGDEPVEAYALLHAYNPETLTNAIAAGMGAGALGAGGALVTLPDGRQVSAVAESLDVVHRAGRATAHLYVHLPPHVLAVVTAQEVRLWRWNAAAPLGPQVAHWPRGSFRATWVDYGSAAAVRVVLESGLFALVSGSAGEGHVEQTLDAIVSLSS